MPTSFKLGQLYHTAQWADCRTYEDRPAFDYARWAQYLGSCFTPYPMPIEIVVCSTQIVTPKQGRAYSIRHLFVRDGRVFTHGEIPSGVQSYDLDRVVLVEVWEDHGDDGHIAWLHIGYRFVASSALAERTRGPPLVMTTNYEWEKEKGNP